MVASSKFNMLSAVVGGLMVANVDAFGFKGGKFGKGGKVGKDGQDGAPGMPAPVAPTPDPEEGCGLLFAVPCSTGTPCTENFVPEIAIDGSGILVCTPPNTPTTPDPKPDGGDDDGDDDGEDGDNGEDMPVPVTPTPVPATPEPVPNPTPVTNPEPVPVPTPMEPVCGEFLPETGLMAPGYKDVKASSQEECAQLCRDDDACVAASYKAKGGCWLRKEFSGVKPDSGKTTFILCEDKPIGGGDDGDDGDTDGDDNDAADGGNGGDDDKDNNDDDEDDGDDDDDEDDGDGDDVPTTPAQEPVCGQFLPETGLIAPGYKDPKASSQEECVQLCRADDACVAVSYKTKGGCWLRTEFSGVKPDSGKITFILCDDDEDGTNGGTPPATPPAAPPVTSTPPPPPPPPPTEDECDVFLEETGLDGDYLQDIPTATEGSCVELCRADTQCEGVTFEADIGVCWLRGSIRGTVPAVGKKSLILCDAADGGDGDAPPAPVPNPPPPPPAPVPVPLPPVFVPVPLPQPTPVPVFTPPPRSGKSGKSGKFGKFGKFGKSRGKFGKSRGKSGKSSSGKSGKSSWSSNSWGGNTGWGSNSWSQRGWGSWGRRWM